MSYSGKFLASKMHNKKNPADRWQRSSFSNVILLQGSVLCQSSPNICQRQLILALALYKKRAIKKGAIAFENAQMMDASPVTDSLAIQKAGIKKAHLMQRPQNQNASFFRGNKC